MITAADRDLPALTRAGNSGPAADAALFALIDELSECEKRRDELLNRLSESGDLIAAAAKRPVMPPERSMSGSPQ